VGDAARWRDEVRQARDRLAADPQDVAATADLSRSLREGVLDYLTGREPAVGEDDAQAAAGESLRLARTLVADMPDDPGALSALFFSLHAQAELLAVSSPAEAVATYWEAAVVGQRRLAVDPDPEQVRLELSWTLRDAGALMSGDSAEASALLDESVALARRHLAARPDDVAATRELAWVLMVAAEHCAAQQPSRALALYQESVLAATAVYDTDPDDDGSRRDLWLALTGVADLLEPDDAEAAHAIRTHADDLPTGDR
jgi:hypothetical protein